MSDATLVLGYLVGAREQIAEPENWWDGSQDGPGNVCALMAFPNLHKDLLNIGRAWELLADAMGISEAFGIADWNDSHTQAEVVAAFDRAIQAAVSEAQPATEPDDPTPLADAAIEVMRACDDAGTVVARHVLAERPELDAAEIGSMVAAELFYAAQDATRACMLDVRLERA